MKRVAATEAKNRLGAILDDAQRFQAHIRHPLETGGEHEEVGVLVDRDELLAAQPAEEADAISDPGGARLLLERGAVRPVPHQVEFVGRQVGAQGQRGQQAGDVLLPG